MSMPIMFGEPYLLKQRFNPNNKSTSGNIDTLTGVKTNTNVQVPPTPLNKSYLYIILGIIAIVIIYVIVIK